MSTTHPTSINSPAAAWPRWPVVVFPAVILAAVGFAAVHILNRTILPFALRLATATGLGLISGFAARRALRDRSGLIRWLAALAGLVVGGLLLGLMTWGNAGIGLPDPSLGGPDWHGLLQVGLGSLAALLALRARRPRVRPTAERPEWRHPFEAWEAVVTRLRASWEGSAPRHGLHWLEVWSSPLRSRIADLLTVTRSGLSWNLLRWRPRPAPSQRSPRVRLIGAEEARCPFCLHLVEQDDSRGVVACPVCHTRHHADCWAVTGMCQVPHDHT